MKDVKKILTNKDKENLTIIRAQLPNNEVCIEIRPDGIYWSIDEGELKSWIVGDDYPTGIGSYLPSLFNELL